VGRNPNHQHVPVRHDELPQQSQLLLQLSPPRLQHTPLELQAVMKQVPEQHWLEWVQECCKGAQVHVLVVGLQYPLQHTVFELQCLPFGVQDFAKTLPSPLSPRMPPRVVAAIVLKAWRREVGVASALVSSSNLVASIAVRSFPSERVAHPGARSAPGGRTVVPYRR
jgi:hypothetical protein